MTLIKGIRQVTRTMTGLGRILPPCGELKFRKRGSSKVNVDDHVEDGLLMIAMIVQGLLWWSSG